MDREDVPGVGNRVISERLLAMQPGGMGRSG
jgi:hypothetical protein